jgi:FAD/FMN-containing dehydrogenase
MPAQIFSGWGNVIRAEHEVLTAVSRQAAFPTLRPGQTLLPYGNGRSYGDTCLNSGATLLQMRALDRFIDFDTQTGVLVCEAGVLLSDILRLIVPRGWFVPVTPGTQFVTVGGAIANDVHGKNHHLAGTFARHVRRFELLRSDDRRLICSLEQNPEWFAATAGGLGLTGVITWAELQLRRIDTPLLSVESIRFRNLEEFLALSAESDRDFEYTVAWVDCLGRGKQLGRGLLQRANHASAERPATAVGRGNSRARPDGPVRVRRLSVPFAPPFSLINNASVHVFNTLHYNRQRRPRVSTTAPFESFFYPLDGVLHWNRLYGPRGFYQYQCVTPAESGREVTAALLDTIARSGLGSFLAVLKLFGDLPSPGMLSFPRPGITLAIDFPNRPERVERLFTELDRIVQDAGGRLYCAKDGRMSREMFRSGYPRWEQFAQYIDPRCSSSFWRRVTGDA